MIGLGIADAKRPGLVALETRADEGDVAVGIAEAGGRAVQRHEAAALRDVVEQGLLLRGFDARGVGVDEQGVVVLEVFERERTGGVLGVDELDTARDHRRGEIAEAGAGLVQAVIAKEENFEGRGVRGERSEAEEEPGCEATKRERNHGTGWGRRTEDGRPRTDEGGLLAITNYSTANLWGGWPLAHWGIPPPLGWPRRKFSHGKLYGAAVWCIVGRVMKAIRQSCGVAGLLAMGLLAGCSSSQMGRIDSNREIYESWPIEIRQAVLDAKVEVGMTPDMVQMAIGKPTEVVASPGGTGEEIWIYRKGGVDDSMMGYPPSYPGAGYPGVGFPSSSGNGGTVGITTGRGGTGITTGGGIGIGGGTGIGSGIGSTGIGGIGGSGPLIMGPPMSRTPVEEREVVFRDGVVFRADPPPAK